jgi:hypothetical protein
MNEKEQQPPDTGKPGEQLPKDNAVHKREQDSQHFPEDPAIHQEITWNEK